jgi:hypothetical protein
VTSFSTPQHRKRILVPLYSQSGQLGIITEQILAPLRESCLFEITVVPLHPVQPYPFPWPFFRFLDAFPESVHHVAPALHPLPIDKDAEFDLILLPYQIWYLAPSLPVQALLQSAQFQDLARNKPVVTIIACRNMWHLAHENVKAALSRMGARLLDNVVLTDQGNTLATFITVPRWLWTGKNDSFLGLPPAGVHPDEIKRARRFGLALRDALQNNQETASHALLTGLAAVKADPTLLFSERAGTRSFKVWGKFVRTMGGPGKFARFPIICLYLVFLISLIITIVPVSLLLQLLIRPLLKNKFAQAKAYFEAPSGSGSERLSLYE